MKGIFGDRLRRPEKPGRLGGLGHERMVPAVGGAPASHGRT
jgi:hypothetical protein